jgi:NAD(P)-dependent dehydrogenase (short-subunit alcohol dehydrogenase family)
MACSVSGATALVTGANRGIGKVILDTLLAEGAAKVYAAVRRVELADRLVDAHGGKVVPIHIDLENPESIANAAEEAADVQLVVNNAGVLKQATPLAHDAIDALQFEMDVNCYGLMRMAQAFAPVLKNNGGGAFVQLNSVASLKSFPDFATYCASKAAAYSITQALKVLLAEQGTHVVSVHPGPIDTDMAETAGLDEVSEPPSLVADAIIAALANGEFHVFPDSFAKRVGDNYASFVTHVLEANLMEG